MWVNIDMKLAAAEEYAIAVDAVVVVEVAPVGVDIDMVVALVVGSQTVLGLQPPFPAAAVDED
jgi:hypothetical protein